MFVAAPVALAFITSMRGPQLDAVHKGVDGFGSRLVAEQGRIPFPMTLDPAADARFVERFDQAFRIRGVDPGGARAALAEFFDAQSSSVLTSQEVAFATTAGVPAGVFNEDWVDLVLLAALRGELDGGPQLTTKQVAERLDHSPANIRRMLAVGDLHAAGQADGEVLYPAWQFTEAGVLHHLRDVIAAFPPGYRPRDIQTVMTSPVEELNGRSPREWLESDEDLEPLLEFLRELSL